MDITVTNRKAELNPVITGDEIIEMRTAIRDMPVSEAVMDYALSLVVATHSELADAPEISKKYITTGASPRAAQAIVKTAKARALMEGRFNVAFEDISYVALPALRHRILSNFEAMSDGVTNDAIIAEIMKETKAI